MSFDIEKFKKKEEAQFEFIFRKYHPQIHFFVKKKLPPEEEDVAEDIAIESFMKMWKTPEKFVTEENIKAFLYLVARNATFNHMERQARVAKSHKEIAYLTPEEEEEDTTLLGDLEMINSDVIAYIKTELEKNTHKFTAILLDYLNGLKTHEIANKLGIAAKTVLNQKLKAIAFLKGKINRFIKHGGAPPPEDEEKISVAVERFEGNIEDFKKKEPVDELVALAIELKKMDDRVRRALMIKMRNIPTKVARIVELYKEGKTTEEIAQIIDLKDENVLKRKSQYITTVKQTVEEATKPWEEILLIDPLGKFELENVKPEYFFYPKKKSRHDRSPVRAYLTYEACGIYLSKQGIRTSGQFAEWTKAGKRPALIPSSPWRTYEEWQGNNWEDFLNDVTYRNDMMSYEEAREWASAIAKKMNLNSADKFAKYLYRNPNIPERFPRHSRSFYERRNEWINWDHFLGMKLMPSRRRVIGVDMWDYDQAKEWVQANFVPKGIDNIWQYIVNRKLLPREMPSQNPMKYYQKYNQWVSVEDFFGAKKRMTYEEQRAIVRELKFGNEHEFADYVRNTPVLPTGFSKSPHGTYRRLGTWISWQDFLGVKELKPKARTEAFLKRYRAYKEAKKWVRATLLPIGVNSQRYFYEYIADPNNKIPDDIPRAPASVYERSGEWRGWADFMGTQNISTVERKANFAPLAQVIEFIQRYDRGSRMTHSRWLAWLRGEDSKIPSPPFLVPSKPKECYGNTWVSYKSVTTVKFTDFPTIV